MAATHDCSQTQRLATFSFGLGGYAADQFIFDGKCTDSHRADAIESMQESDANQTHLDIYNAALQQSAETETSTAVYDNYMNDTESAAWMQAEMAIASAYQNGSSKSLAKSKARQAIAEYYAVKQINLIERHNTTVAGYETLYRRAENESALTASSVLSFSGSGTGDTQSVYYDGTRNTTVTLTNGSTHGDLAVAITSQDQYDGHTTTGVAGVDEHNADSSDAYQEVVYGHTASDLYAVAPNDNYDDATYLTFSTFGERWDRIVAQNDALQAEVDPFVNNTWTAYESGEIDSADVLSRNTQMFRYGQAATDGTNSTYDVVAALSSMGLDSPELNGTGTMEVQYKGATYNGLLMARNAPNGSWQAGTTYNTSNIDGPVLLAHTGGQTLELTGEFTVSSITSESGDEINEVQTTKVVYKTSNTSELLTKMNEIEKLRQEIESREPKPGGGGTSDGGDGLLNKLAAALGVSVGAAVAVLAAIGLVVLRIYSPN